MSTLSFRGSIGALASAAAVNVETIRFYQRRGLLAEPPGPPGRVRQYGPTHVDRVRFIKTAQRLGFSLADVASLVRTARRRGSWRSASSEMCATSFATCAAWSRRLNQPLRSVPRHVAL
jgi:DNA-binding transcriptional MerR regulator